MFVGGLGFRVKGWGLGLRGVTRDWRCLPGQFLGLCFQTALGSNLFNISFGKVFMNIWINYLVGSSEVDVQSLGLMV